MNKIYIGNLPYQISNDDLESYFSSCGEIKDIKIIKDRDTGRSKGFAFLEFDEESAATEACSSMDGKDFQGRNLKVSLAREDNRGGSGSRDKKRW